MNYSEIIHPSICVLILSLVNVMCCACRRWYSHARSNYSVCKRLSIIFPYRLYANHNGNISPFLFSLRLISFQIFHIGSNIEYHSNLSESDRQNLSSNGRMSWIMIDYTVWGSEQQLLSYVSRARSQPKHLMNTCVYTVQYTSIHAPFVSATKHGWPRTVTIDGRAAATVATILYIYTHNTHTHFINGINGNMETTTKQKKYTPSKSKYLESSQGNWPNLIVRFPTKPYHNDRTTYNRAWATAKRKKQQNCFKFHI